MFRDALICGANNGVTKGIDAGRVVSSDVCRALGAGCASVALHEKIRGASVAVAGGVGAGTVIAGLVEFACGACNACVAPHVFMTCTFDDVAAALRVTKVAFAVVVGQARAISWAWVTDRATAVNAGFVLVLHSVGACQTWVDGTSLGLRVTVSCGAVCRVDTAATIVASVASTATVNVTLMTILNTIDTGWWLGSIHHA